MTDFERQLRYHALRGKTAELLQQKLLSLSEYYRILQKYGQKYLGDVSPPGKEGACKD